MIYLDYAATTSMSEKAIEAYAEVAKKIYANSSSLHDFGESASRIIENSRKMIASIIHSDPKGIYFTRGGSDGNFLCLQSLINSLPKDKNHIISSRLEHSSIKNYLRYLETQGYDVTYLTPDEHGAISTEVLEKALNEHTGLITIQHGNSEIGTVQNLKVLSSIAKKQQILFHSDCVQTFGKVTIDVGDLEVDALTFSAHKVHGPKAVGAVYINPKTAWVPVIQGTTHENGFVPGTVNTPGIAAFAIAVQESIGDVEYIKELRSYFLTKLKPIERVSVINETHAEQLPHLIGCIITGIEGQYTMLECNRYGIAISTGSACLVGMREPSDTLMSIGKTVDESLQYIRVSFGRNTTKTEIDIFITTIQKLIDSFPNGYVKAHC